jgi:pyruvate dehydrogenase E2 component (dihydrolipoamide acetyltransferase)
MGEFRMPSLGADMDTGTLVAWRVAPGDHVSRGDIVATVDTDKAVIDVEVFETGVVAELLVEEGATVPVGTPLARIEAAGATTAPTPPATEPPAPTAEPPEPVRTPTTPPVEAPSPRIPAGRGHRHASVLVSPVVRHLAERLHVDAAGIEGSGVGGRVTRADVEAAAAAPSPAAPSTTAPSPTAPSPTAPSTRAPSPPAPSGARPAPAPRDGSPPASPRARRAAVRLGVDLASVPPGSSGAVHERDVVAAAGRTKPAAGRTAPLSGDERLAASRRATARGMERSNREIPHYHLTETVDLTAATEWLRARNEGRDPGDRLVPAALLLAATARAATAEPDVNGWWADDELHHADHVDLGVAVSLRTGGLVTPTITAAEERSVEELMAALRGAVERARRGALRSSELGTGSLTVTNLGDRGAEVVHGVIHPPQVALVGFGRIAPRPMVVDGDVVARTSVVMTLAGDHRASDGHVGSRFLRRIATLLTHPDRLDTA